MNHSTHTPVRCKGEGAPNADITWQFLYNHNGSAFSGELNENTIKL